MLDRGRADLHCVRHVARIAGVRGEREVLRMRFLSHRARDQQIQPIEQHPLAPTGFENCLNAIHTRGFQFAHLATGLIRGLRRAHQLRFHHLLHRPRHIANELGPVPALSGKHRTAQEQLRPQLAALRDLRAYFEGCIQAVARAARRGHAAIQQRRG